MSDKLMSVRQTMEKDELIQLVTFELDNEEYGVDVLNVREIIRMPELTKMPNAPSHVEGVINLRGSVIPVISLRKRFYLFDHENDARSRILVMELGGRLVGFIVDSVAEVIRIAASSLQAPPDVTYEEGVQKCIVGILNHNERLLIMLDLNELFSEHDSSL